MAAPPSKQLALDTNVLIDLANGEDAALSLKEFLAESKKSVGIPPAVVQELSLLLDSREASKSPWDHREVCGGLDFKGTSPGG